MENSRKSQTVVITGHTLEYHGKVNDEFELHSNVITERTIDWELTRKTDKVIFPREIYRYETESRSVPLRLNYLP